MKQILHVCAFGSQRPGNFIESLMQLQNRMQEYMHLLKMQKIDHGVKIFRKQIEFIFCQWQEQEYYLRHIY